MATIPPKIATAKYLRVPTAKLPSALSAGSRPGRCLTIRSPNTEPSTARKISRVMMKNSEVSTPKTLDSRDAT